MEDEYYAVACEDDQCLETVRVGSKAEAIEMARLGCPQCYGHAVPMHFTPMGRGIKEAKK